MARELRSGIASSAAPSSKAGPSNAGSPAARGPFDSLHRYPTPSRRSAVLANGGIVATSQPLAAQAGLAVLVDGGTAVDAAITAAAMLTVVEPCSNGLGSDAFAIINDGTTLHGFNGSGRWPAASDPDAIRAAGHTEMPQWGWTGVTVPGAVDAWAQLHDRFGRLPMERLLAPATHYARNGHPVAPVISLQWREAFGNYTRLGLPETADWATVFAPDGTPPRSGVLWASPGHAHGLTVLARDGLRSFYEGEIADAIVAYSDRTGGTISSADLASHRGEWVDPISIRYGDYDIWEIPPNGQGIAALMALGIASHTGAAQLGQLDPQSWHLQIEAMKLAFADTDSYVGDQQHSAVPVAGMLDAPYLAERAAQIGPSAAHPNRGEPSTGGTVYLCAADADGMMVSFIQSNYHGFGSGVVVPSHGISLQNRGAGFVLEPGHPNEAKPGKRPRHTIIPGFITRAADGQPIGPFGVMGGEMQPQGHLQVITGMLDHGLNPQATLDTPRWQVNRDWTVMVEPETPEAIIDGLQQRGHEVQIVPHRIGMGRGQIIWRSDDGVYAAGSEPRADGCAVGI